MNQLKKHLKFAFTSTLNTAGILSEFAKSCQKREIGSNLRCTFDQRSASRGIKKWPGWLAEARSHVLLLKDWPNLQLWKRQKSRVAKKKPYATASSTFVPKKCERENFHLSNSQQMVSFRYLGSEEIEEETLFCFALELEARGIDVFNKGDVYFKTPNVD